MTFSSKIERIYFSAKGLFIASAAFWIYIGSPHTNNLITFTILFSIYIAINILMFLLSQKRMIKSRGILFYLFSIDTVFLGISIMLDGGAQSQLFIGYYVLIGLLSVYLPAKEVGVVVIVFSLSYILVALFPFNAKQLVTIIMRIFYFWLLGGIGYMVAYHMKTSERKVLRTLDILNERTWELETSQVMLENVYETTRALSTILEMDQLLEEVLDIANKLLRVRKCTILLSGESGKNLYLYAESNKGKKTFYDPPLMYSEIRPVGIDMSSKSPFSDKNKIFSDKKPFMLDLPLISHGKMMGIMQLEPLKKGEFSEKERKSFTMFANSTAMAIDMARLHKKMQDLTVIDELTGLYNYRFFGSKLTDEIRRSDRYHQKISLLMIDIDHFKRINDSQGHQTGNIILQEIASVIKQSVRDVDIVARYGGEEFMVILPQTDLSDAKSIAGRIRAQMEDSYFSNAQGQRYMKVTVSIGVAIYPNGVFSAEQLLEKVDRAMYLAKKQGRNRVCVAPVAKEEMTGKLAQ